jgi:hypothetical protein
MNQALYAHMNNKRKIKKINKNQSQHDSFFLNILWIVKEGKRWEDHSKAITGFFIWEETLQRG